MPLYSQLTTLRKIRQFTLATIAGLTETQFNQIPEGYNNNIIWNVAHMIAAEQGVCYLRAGIPTVIPEEFYTAYKPGSKPEKTVSETEIESIKLLLLGSVDKLKRDLDAQIFDNYTPWATRYGVEMNNINDALNFLPFHEGMHLGYIMALKRLV